MPDQRLRRCERIRSSGEIRRILKNGARCQAASFDVVWIQNCESMDRYAVLTSRKLGSAVARNRCKRVLREMLRRYKRSNPPFLDIVLIPRRIVVYNSNQLASWYLEWQRVLRHT